MQPRLSKNQAAAMTLFEVCLVIAIVLVLAALLLPTLTMGRRKTSRLGCVNNLRQVGLCYRIWAGDSGDKYPMGVSVANGGTMEMVATGNVVLTFMVMSNYLSTPKVLVCQMDTARFYATSFASLANSNLSYFIGVDVTNYYNNPQMIISGDRNLQIGRLPVRPGLVPMWTNDPVAWTTELHNESGNIGLADGSVMATTSANLRSFLQQTGLATNRLAVP
jgi:prepilin-type processing-associated H-X9-DG protein